MAEQRNVLVERKFSKKFSFVECDYQIKHVAISTEVKKLALACFDFL
jgi:hypothetical protein